MFLVNLFWIKFNGLKIQNIRIKLFNSLKEKLGEQQAESPVNFLKSSIKEEVIEQIPNIATKDFVEAKISEAKFQIIRWAFFFGQRN